VFYRFRSTQTRRSLKITSQTIVGSTRVQRFISAEIRANSASKAKLPVFVEADQQITLRIDTWNNRQSKQNKPFAIKLHRFFFDASSRRVSSP
jgi:hypothetical protein